MSGIFPSTPGFSGMKISSLQPTLVSVSHNLKRQARSRGGAQRWWLEAEYPPNLTRAELAPIFAFALAQRGQYETFTLVPPALWSTARGVATGTPLVNGASQIGRTVHTDGWTAGVTGILLAGDFVKFNGQDKVYMVTANANSNGLGQADIVIEPAFIASPADNESLIVTNVPFLVSFASDVQEFTLSSPDQHGFKVSFVEVV